METQFPDWMFALAGVVATPIIALIKVKFQSRQARFLFAVALAEGAAALVCD